MQLMQNFGNLFSFDTVIIEIIDRLKPPINFLEVEQRFVDQFRKRRLPIGLGFIQNAEQEPSVLASRSVSVSSNCAWFRHQNHEIRQAIGAEESSKSAWTSGFAQVFQQGAVARLARRGL